MSVKPCRGCGLVFQDAFNREMKYRGLLADFDAKPVGFMKWSKAYYHWLIAERDLQRLNFPSRCKILKELYGMLVGNTILQSFEQNRELCYKPLQRLMP